MDCWESATSEEILTRIKAITAKMQARTHALDEAVRANQPESTE